MKSNINASAITNDKALQTVTAELSKLDIAGSQVKLAVSELNNYLVISNKEQQDDAMIILKLCKDVETAIEKRRKELVTPFNNTVKQYNDYAKKLTGDLSAAIENVKNAVLKFQAEEKEKALIQRTTQREAALIQIGLVFNGDQNLYALAEVGSISYTELKQYDDASFNQLLSAWTETINRKRQQAVDAIAEQNEFENLLAGNDEVFEIANADMAPVITAPVNGQKVEAVKGTTKRWVFDITDASLIPREYLIVNETAIRAAIANGERNIPGVNIYQKESLSIR